MSPLAGMAEEGCLLMTLDEIFCSRRSCRAYDSRPVPEEALAALCEAARLAPSACNSQTWRFVVVRDRAVIGRICDEAMRPVVPNRWAKEAPVLIAGCSRLDLLANRIGSAVTGIEYYQIDLGIAMEHMVLKATELGLGTCWVSWFVQDEIRPVLGLPEDKYVVAILTLGVPDQAPKPRPRRPLEDVVRYEKW